MLCPALVVDLELNSPVVGEHGRACANRQRRDVYRVHLEPGAFGNRELQDGCGQARVVDGCEPGELWVGEDVDGLGPGNSLGVGGAVFGVRRGLGDILPRALDLARHIGARSVPFLVPDVGVNRQFGIEQDAGDLSVRGASANEGTRDGPDGLGAVAAVFVGLWPFPDQTARRSRQLSVDLRRQVVQD
jgi:hypothetical protein